MVELDVSELSSLQPDELAARLGGKRAFDAVVSVDFLSCLAFGAGLDPDEADRRCGEYRAQLQKTAEPLPTDENYYERAGWVSGQREGPNDLVCVFFI